MQAKYDFGFGNREAFKKYLRSFGYGCVEFKSIIGGSYWMIKTPSNNIMEVDFYDDDNTLSVKSVSLCYKPSFENGNSCSCLNEDGEKFGSKINSMKVLHDLEITGLNYENSIGAKLYSNEEIDKKWREEMENKNGVIVSDCDNYCDIFTLGDNEEYREFDLNSGTFLDEAFEDVGRESTFLDDVQGYIEYCLRNHIDITLRFKRREEL